MSIVAEGVETVAVWNTLASIGCDAAQGYYVAPPLEPDALDRWLLGGIVAGETTVDSTLPVAGAGRLVTQAE